MASSPPPSRSLLQRIRRFLNLRHEVAGLHHEVHSLRFQRDVLERERDELKALVEGRAVLERERDELKAHATRLNEAVDRLTLGHCFPRGHFYSPIADPSDGLVQETARAFERRGELPVPPFIDADAMRRVFEKLSVQAARLDFPLRHTPPKRYFRDNISFGSGDALILGGIMLERRPKRIIEIGSGRSSHVMMDVNDQFFDGAITLDFIEPHPATFLENLGPEDPYRQRLHQQRSQEVPVEFYASLEPGDILFIDSSHVLKTASDVEDQWRRIIPALRPGVLIHIHDMMDGFEYPPEWVVTENRSWNELYLVRHVLAYSSQFRVLFFNDFFFHRNRDLTGRLMPQAQENGGASLWMEKIA